MEPLGQPAVKGTGAPGTAVPWGGDGDGQSQGLGLARPRQGFPRGCPQPALTQDQRAAPQGGSGKRSVGSGWTIWGARGGCLTARLCLSFASLFIRLLASILEGGWGADRLPRQPPGDHGLVSASPCLGCFPCGAGCCPGAPPPALHFTPGLVQLNIL